MRITLENNNKYHRFALRFEYSEDKIDFCRTLKDSFGWQEFNFTSDNDDKKWVFSDILFVNLIKQRFPDVNIDFEVLEICEDEEIQDKKEQRKIKKIDSIRSKTEASIKIKNIKGEPYEYQKIGVEFLMASGGRAIIADAPGVGKSLQSLAYVAHNELKRVLVVCPASVKSAWEKEIKKWTKLSCVIINSDVEISEIDSDVNLWIINYDILKKFLPELAKIRFDAMIVDECHLIKSITAQRTKAVKLLSRDIPRIVLLSGTPLLSRPIEMFTLLNIIDPKTWSNYYDFGRKYCGGHQGRWGWDVSGSTNTEELHEKIKKYFIRRKKADVLKELPKKNYIDVSVEMDEDKFEELEMIEDNLVRYLKQYKGKQPPEIAKMLQAQKLAQLGLIRRLIANSGTDRAEDLIESILEADEKILVFSSYNEPLEKLKEHFGKEAVMITGKTPVGDRGRIVESFQKDPKIKVFLGGFLSAGTGITLTAASNVLKLDYPWNPADIEQATNRAHRPGAEYEILNIYQIHVNVPMTEKLKKILDKKQLISDQIIEGQKIQQTETNIVNELLEDLMERKGKGWQPMDLS